MLTLFAGLSTGVGCALAFFSRQTNTRFLANTLGFSGVMLYVSFVEIISKAMKVLGKKLGNGSSAWAAVVGFFW